MWGCLCRRPLLAMASKVTRAQGWRPVPPFFTLTQAAIKGGDVARAGRWANCCTSRPKEDRPFPVTTGERCFSRRPWDLSHLGEHRSEGATIGANSYLLPHGVCRLLADELT